MFPLSGEKLKNHEERCELQIECLMALEQWDRASDSLAKMIRNTPDQWSDIRQYISCQIKRCQAKRKECLGAQTEVGCEGGVNHEEGCGDELPTSSEGVPDPPDACRRVGECEEVWSWNDLRRVGS